MDRNVVIATVLIMGILLVWMYMIPPPVPAPEPLAQDTLQLQEQIADTQRPVTPVQVDSTMVGVFEGEERLITVDTDLYTARLSTRGATLVNFLLKEYAQFDQVSPVQLVDTSGAGALGLEFQSPNGRNRDSRTFYFAPSFDGDSLHVTNAGTELSFEARLSDGTLRLTYEFEPETYEIGLRVTHTNGRSFQTDDGYEIVWNGALPFSEDPGNRKEEVAKIGAYARTGDEVDGISLAGDEEEGMTLRGNVSWMAVKNKYFAAVVLSDERAREAELFGERRGETDDEDVDVTFRASLFMNPPTDESDSFRLYLGPLEYYEIKEYDGLYDMIDYGWNAFEWMTRPLATFIFIPAFTLLSSFIANYGVVIIIFGLLIKLALFPLTKSSYKSMAQMRELQPQMQAIKEKYKDDPQKQQAATMKLYKESGTNPLGSCLPMLLQYPIIIALWQFLQQSIEIRQEGFLWANDLSAPDAVLNLPITIPFYGDFVAGFTVLMGLSMIVQMRIQSTPASGVQAKIFMYVMPAFIFVIFNRLPSGLSLYYLCYNVVTAFQQKLINKSLEKKKVHEEASTRRRSKKARHVTNKRKGKRSKKR